LQTGGDGMKLTESQEHELAGLLILENRLIDEREKLMAQLQPVRIRIGELLKKKREIKA
jgi:hypothetical protein